MKKRYISLALCIIVMAVMISCVNEDISERDTANLSPMSLRINNIELTVTSDGIINRVLNGEKSEIDYNTENNQDVTFLKLDNWNETFTALVEDNKTKDRKIITSGLGGVWSEPELMQFAESDIPITGDEKFQVNDTAIIGDQLLAGCDTGVLLVLTPCAKCYKLKKVCDFNIADVSIDFGKIVLVGTDKQEISVPLEDIRQDNIEADAALELKAKGAILIDVREPDEFAEKYYEDSLNIPLAEVEQRIGEYDRDKVLIFYCASGIRSEKALKTAQDMGFLNVYNLGSVDKLLQ